jgi:uncharacterized protein (DUF1800 family)
MPARDAHATRQAARPAPCTDREHAACTHCQQIKAARARKEAKEQREWERQQQKFALSRRAFLTTSLAALSAAACSPVIDRMTQPELPDDLALPTGSGRNPAAHLLNRAGYGPRPGQVAAVEAMGRDAWIDQQLNYTAIEDEGMDLRLRRYDTLSMSAADLKSFGRDKDYLSSELGAMTLVRAMYSGRQLFEVMVGFWTDHFSIYHFKEEVIVLKTVDDREVVRPHALGAFGDLLRASAHSPAMLRYLDNTANEKSHPNENYAREIMELHTLGVDGGYVENDIYEVARCFTGWSVDGSGAFTYREEWHDTGEKIVLGQVIPADGGKDDGDRVLDILLAHPSTARYVSTKLARRFVADEPSAALVDALVAVWNETGGDIKAIVRALLNHPDFAAAPPKLKRPFDLVASLLRATNARYNGDADLMDRLGELGQRPFAWPTPDGYPDTAEEWSGNLLARWNFCLNAFSGDLPGVDINVWDIAEAAGAQDDAQATLRAFGRLLFSRDLSAAEESPLWNYATGGTGRPPDLTTGEGRIIMLETLALLAASPAFQWK